MLKSLYGLIKLMISNVEQCTIMYSKFYMVDYNLVLDSDWNTEIFEFRTYIAKASLCKLRIAGLKIEYSAHSQQGELS